MAAFRVGNMGLGIISDKGGTPMLFDLSTDPGERHDLSATRPDDLARLQAALQTGLQARSTPALDEYAEFLTELQQRGYWEAVAPK